MNNENNNEDTMYFGEDSPNTYENNNSYTEDDMQDVYHPMTNTNSVEYDSNDYESDTTEEEEGNDGKKKMIIAYIITIVVIMLIIMISLLKLLKG